MIYTIKYTLKLKCIKHIQRLHCLPSSSLVRLYPGLFPTLTWRRFRTPYCNRAGGPGGPQTRLALCSHQFGRTGH